MNYILLAFSLLATQAAYGASAPATPTVVEPATVQHEDPLSAYGALVAARKFRTLDEPSYEVSLWGELHNGFSRTIFADQCQTMNGYFAHGRKAKTPHLFLLEIDPFIKGPIPTTTPTRYVAQLVAQNKDFATADYFDHRPIGLRNMSCLVDKLYKLLQHPQNDLQHAITQLYRSEVPAQIEANVLEEIANTKQHLLRLVGQIKNCSIMPEETIKNAESDIDALSAHSFLSITTADSFIKALHQLAQSGRLNVAVVGGHLTRVARVIGDGFLLTALNKGLKTHKRITIVGGFAHNLYIEKILDKNGFFPCVGFDCTHPLSAQHLTDNQLREAFALPAASNSESNAKQAADVEGKQAAAQNAAAAPVVSGSAQAKQLTCNACNKTLNKKSRCGTCKKVYYCDAKCQRADWPKHKEVCRK